MVSHDCVAFYLLSEEVSKHVKVVQSGQGADEIFAGYHWYPPMAHAADADPDDALARYRTAFFDRDHDAVNALLQPRWRLDDDVAGRFAREHFAHPGAATATDRALRLDTTVMLVDDPVKRVDNMTMAWGLEGRVPFLDHELVELAATCPPELKTAYDGKGVLKEAARKVIPHEVIDRPKGYFPVPALKHLAGPYLDLVRDALHSRLGEVPGVVRTGCGRFDARRSQRQPHAAARKPAVAVGIAGTVAGPPRGRGRASVTSEVVRDETHPRRRPGPRLGTAGVRPDVRRPRPVRQRPAGRGQRQARHRHVPRRAARLRGAAPAGVLHRPELHLPADVRQSAATTSRRRCRACRCGRWPRSRTARRSTRSTCSAGWCPPTST